MDDVYACGLATKTLITNSWADLETVFIARGPSSRPFPHIPNQTPADGKGTTIMGKKHAHSSHPVFLECANGTALGLFTCGSKATLIAFQ
ncbi:hypothetical protein AVEN_209549-1 [Araneus ventricosus]|uniref:Uncharacterized protein n=1 Tax=Araneus ventricosus TaxID=182803 RepID=A0A4Y2P9U1_ARAVE|nr:hypothetical protein AVEN_209549-1 [Araneus ventricosus]